MTWNPRNLLVEVIEPASVEPPPDVVVVAAQKFSARTSDYRVPETEEVTVFGGVLPATFILAPASGSFRKHTIINAGTATLTIAAATNEYILGRPSQRLRPHESVSLVDRDTTLWSAV